MIQPASDDTRQDFFHIYKSQPRCEADLSTSAVALAPDFRIDLGDSVIINRLYGESYPNTEAVAGDMLYTLTGEPVSCDDEEEDGDGDDFALSSVAQATVALVTSLIAISAF